MVICAGAWITKHWDWLGLPKMSLRFKLSERDLQHIQMARDHLQQPEALCEILMLQINTKQCAINGQELVVYIGAAPLGGSILGLATPGGFSASGSKSWLNAVRARGQAGALDWSRAG